MAFLFLQRKSFETLCLRLELGMIAKSLKKLGRSSEYKDGYNFIGMMALSLRMQTLQVNCKMHHCGAVCSWFAVSVNLPYYTISLHC